MRARVLLRGLSARRTDGRTDGRSGGWAAVASRRGFSLERGLRKSLPFVPLPLLVLLVSLSPPLVPLHPSVTPLPSPSSHPSPLSRRVARSSAALPIGADTPRGVEADFSLFGTIRSSSDASVGPSAGHPPSCSRHTCSLKPRACMYTVRCRGVPSFHSAPSQVNYVFSVISAARRSLFIGSLSR